MTSRRLGLLGALPLSGCHFLADRRALRLLDGHAEENAAVGSGR